MVCTQDDRPASKVADLLDEYDLDGFGAELEARWTDDGPERMSLRELADYFNRRLLETALLDAGLSTLGSDVETTYENLTGDDVSAGVRTDTHSRLERSGVDPGELTRDFVTYQAIRTYLKEWRGAEYERPSDAEKVESDLESIQRLVTRTLSVIEGRLENLRDTGRIRMGEFEVIFGVRVLCQECGTQHQVPELLRQGGCTCGDGG